MNAAENRIDWAKLLNEALTEPGRIHEAYSRFRGYSLGNRIWALTQCLLRGISPGPLASFNRWKELGRHIKKGERAIALCMPVTCKRKSIEADEETETTTYQRFMIKNN